MSGRRFLAYAGLYGASATILRLAGAALYFWLARMLTVNSYATFGLLYALHQGVATFALAGIVEAVVGSLRRRRTPKQLIRLFASANVAFVCMTAGAGVFGVAIWVAYYRNADIGIVGYASVLFSGALMAFASLQSQLTRLDERHNTSLLFGLVPPFTALAGGFVGFLLTRTTTSFFLGTTAGLLASLLVLRLCGAGRWQVAAGVVGARRVLLKAIPFIAVAFLGWLSGYGTNYLIALFLKPGEIARFTFGLSVASVMLLVAGAVNQVWAPRFYRLIQERSFDEVERMNGDFHRVLGVVLSAVGGLLVAAFPAAMRVLGGHLLAYSSMQLELSLLFAGYVFLTPWWHCQYHFLSNSMGRSFLKLSLTTSAIGIGALIALIWILGPIGIYLGFASQMLLRSIGMLIVARRKWPVEVSWTGVAVGLAMIGTGLIISSLGVPLVPAVLGYVTTIAILVAVFMRDDWSRVQAMTRASHR